MSKQVHSIMSYVAGSTKTPLLKLYETFGWDLYKRFGHAYEAFKLIVRYGLCLSEPSVRALPIVRFVPSYSSHVAAKHTSAFAPDLHSAAFLPRQRTTNRPTSSGDTSPLSKYDLPAPLLKALTTTIGRRLAPQPFKLRADVEVTCFAYEGIDAIKAALKEGEQVVNFIPAVRVP
jgi:translation initiation factor 2 alpha subunit (eIF-2alpha)